MPTIATNKRAYYDHTVLEEYRAGIVLSGPEVRSVKNGRITLQGGFVTIRDNQLWLTNVHISPYPMARQPGYVPTHERKLLLTRKEIASLIGTLSQKGLTILPLSVYTKGSLIKVTLGVCRGKKLHDKREAIKRKESDRRLRQLMRRR